MKQEKSHPQQAEGDAHQPSLHPEPAHSAAAQLAKETADRPLPALGQQSEQTGFDPLPVGGGVKAGQQGHTPGKQRSGQGSGRICGPFRPCLRQMGAQSAALSLKLGQKPLQAAPEKGRQPGGEMFQMRPQGSAVLRPGEDGGNVLP